MAAPNAPRAPTAAYRQIGITGKATYPIPAQVATHAQEQPTGASIVGFNQQLVNLGIPAITGNAAALVTFTVQLTTFPTTFTVPIGSTGNLIAHLNYNVGAIDTIILGAPGVSVIFGGFTQGSPILSPGQYTAPSIMFSVPVHAPSGSYAGGTIALIVWAMLLVS